MEREPKYTSVTVKLKAKVRNLSGCDSTKAQTLIRNFIMERFLERMGAPFLRNGCADSPEFAI